MTPTSKSRGAEGALPARSDEDAARTEKLSQAETTRLYQPVAELMAQANWDMLPKMFAIGLAVHRLLEEKAPEIREQAQSILDQSRKKKD